MHNYFPMGKYCYKHLPMGVTNSPDISKQKMNDLFQVFEFIYAYIQPFYSEKFGFVDHTNLGN